MRSISTMAMGAMFVLFTIGSIASSAALAQDEVNMVFHVEGMY